MRAGVKTTVGATRLERACQRIEAGEYKGALDDLWHAEAEHRSNKRGLEEARSLGNVLVAQASGRVRKDGQLLVTVLASDLDRLANMPGTTSHAEVGPTSRLATTLGLSAAVALGLAAIFFAGAGMTFDLSEAGTRADVSLGFFYASLACAALSVVAAIGWAIVTFTARRRRSG